MVVKLIKALHTASSTSSLTLSESLQYHQDKASFISAYPSYPDSALTRLRRKEFGRLDANGGSVYLDYTGASLYPASLISTHSRWLKRVVAGNPHSTSPASLLSSEAMDEARRTVLEFFDADEQEYDVVWTSNASGGFRIVGETYDWRRGKKVLIPRDAHNSLNSLARKAQSCGGQFEFVEFDSSSHLADADGERDTISKQAYVDALSSGSPSSEASEKAVERGLIFFTGQSNITGAKLDLSLPPLAKSLGWDVGLDAAALAPSTRISLRALHNSVDYMVVSLYKICGYPTGLGALILRKGMYAKMTQKQTFFGGNIIGITMDRFDFSLVEGPERFEDGTANFASMVAVKPGLEFAAKWMDKVGKRNRALMEWVVKELDAIRYPAVQAGGQGGGGRGEKKRESGGSIDNEKTSTTFSSSSSSTDDNSRGGETLGSGSSMSSLRKQPHPSSCSATAGQGVKLVRIGGPTTLSSRGFTLPLVFSSAKGESLNYRFVIWAAAQENISLRGGPCMCNPGASSSVMQRGLITDLEASSLLAVADVGIVRVSLGLATNFKDVWRLVHFCRKLTNSQWIESMWAKYVAAMTAGAAGMLSNNIDELQALATRKRSPSPSS